MDFSLVSLMKNYHKTTFLVKISVYSTLKFLPLILMRKIDLSSEVEQVYKIANRKINFFSTRRYFLSQPTKFCWHLSLGSRLISTFWRHETIAGWSVWTDDSILHLVWFSVFIFRGIEFLIEISPPTIRSPCCNSCLPGPP